MSARVRCVLSENGSSLTFQGTNTWILSEPGFTSCVVVDPGPGDGLHIAMVRDSLDACGLHARAILLTHGHVDHAEGAARLSLETGAPVYSRDAENLDDGVLSFDGGVSVEVISLPGHSSDSIGICFPRDASILTGDTIFEKSTTLIDWPDGSLSEYLATLERLRSLADTREVRRFLPGHGMPIDEPVARIDQCERHRRERLDQIRALIAQDRVYRTNPYGVMRALYTDIDPSLVSAALRTVRAQLHYLTETGDPCMNPCDGEVD